MTEPIETISYAEVMARYYKEVDRRPPSQPVPEHVAASFPNVYLTDDDTLDWAEAFGYQMFRVDTLRPWVRDLIYRNRDDD